MVALDLRSHTVEKSFNKIALLSGGLDTFVLDHQSSFVTRIESAQREGV